MSEEAKNAMVDLGLSYAEAAHGVQSVKASELAGIGGIEGQSKFEPKHMRVGIDLSKSDQMGLASLLMDKGVFTMEEYQEYMRLAANDELAREQNKYGTTFR